MEEEVKSPCKNICIRENGVCIGCYRTVEEIARWRTLSNDGKKIVLRNAKRRKAEIKGNQK